MLRNDIHIDEKTHTLTRVTTYDAVPIMEQAYFERLSGCNGFSDGRNQRVIGEVPLAEFFEMLRIADEQGEPLTGTGLKGFLAENPEYRTVNNIDTGHTGRIIVK
ncbi:hypothetical protein [Maridesulfovibrio sp.]|uniref:hypothetical protein n=1 Tax=Maridesulfovibrio sp. TaxID=2795000 RepID=UPI002AA862BC|nr:hypothetical protein [Maridesulfovibrio sp.]